MRVLSDVSKFSQTGETIESYNDLLIITEVLSEEMKRQVWNLSLERASILEN